jgi:hypothetical protein
VGPACAASGSGRGIGGAGNSALAADPLHAVYQVDGQLVRLSGGLAEAPAAPGSATRVRTAIYGEPTYGDLDGDGIDDAALFLLHDPGGSGTFYYLAAALRTGDGYRGTNAVLLGDRVAPQTIVIRNGVLVARYLDRRPGEPMAAAPTVGVTKVLVLQGGEVVDVPMTGPEGLPETAVQEGWLTIGHEVRTFQPCGERSTLWISGDAPAWGEIQAAYRRALPDSAPYAPLFAVVAGRQGERPTEGFGTQYDGSFFATRLLQVWPKGNCRSENIVLDEPLPGQVVTSPLTLRGRARGSWFFEGDFPVELRDAKGEILARHYAAAQGEWMTKRFVPFEGRIEFPKPEQPQAGTLVLRKDNPSENRALDDVLEIPVTFQ